MQFQSINKKGLVGNQYNIKQLYIYIYILGFI